MAQLKRILLSLYGLLLQTLGENRVSAILTLTAATLVQRLAPKRSLPFLLDLDSRLYPLQGKAAVLYDNGLHIKHRLMRYHDFFVERISVGQTVLDVGCGNGAVAHSVASRSGAKVTGIDFNAENIAQARSRYVLSNLEFVHGDVLADLPQKRFDVVILSNVLEHFERRVDFLQSLRQRINPDLIMVRVPFFERDWRVAAKRELGLEWRLDNTHCIEYDLPTFFDEVRQGGLGVIECEVHWGEIWAVLREVST